MDEQEIKKQKRKQGEEYRRKCKKHWNKELERNRCGQKGMKRGQGPIYTIMNCNTIGREVAIK